MFALSCELNSCKTFIYQAVKFYDYLSEFTGTKALYKKIKQFKFNK